MTTSADFDDADRDQGTHIPGSSTQTTSWSRGDDEFTAIIRGPFADERVWYGSEASVRRFACM